MLHLVTEFSLLIDKLDMFTEITCSGCLYMLLGKMIYYYCSVMTHWVSFMQEYSRGHSQLVKEFMNIT